MKTYRPMKMRTVIKEKSVRKKTRKQTFGMEEFIVALNEVSNEKFTGSDGINHCTAEIWQSFITFKTTARLQ